MGKMGGRKTPSLKGREGGGGEGEENIHSFRCKK